MIREPAAALQLGLAMDVARRLFTQLRAATADDPGVTRVAYGPGECKAFELVAHAARAHGADVAFDSAGNQFATVPGGNREHRIVIGSHLDSVPHGGNFDGAAGVILGIAVQAWLAENRLLPAFDLTVACLRAEESCWFPHSYIGSKTALGRLDPAVPDKVKRSDSGKSLAWHMSALGFDPAGVRQGARVLTPASIVAYIEPHIEQAPLLVSEALPVGVVTGIRGSFRYRKLRNAGAYSHSGAMPHQLRRDSVLAAARLVVAAEALWQQLEAEGHDLTITFGEAMTDPGQHSFSKVAGEMQLCLDVRSQSRETLDLVERLLREEAQEIAAATGTSFDFGERTGSEPAVMSSRLVDFALASCAAAAVPARRMASGAGHDAATFAQAGVPSLMLFIRNANGSHNPDEHMELADFEQALRVVCHMLMQPAAAWREERAAA